jgi:SH3-like domain-containing protein
VKLPALLFGLPLLLSAGVSSAETLSVKTSSANFRERPHEAAKIKFSADKFFPVEVIEKKSGWVKVKDFEGDEAWVAEKVLAKQPAVVITAERANIREKANTSGDVLFKVERGEVFKVEERSGSWIKVVDARGDGGWIRADMTWGLPDEPKPKPVDDKAALPDGKPKPEISSANAKEPEKKPDLESLEAKLSTQEHLKMLCQSYLDEVEGATGAKTDVLKTLCTSYVDKASPAPAKPAAAPKSADKPKPKPAAKPKADKKKN